MILQCSRVMSCVYGERVEFNQGQIGKRIHLEIGVEVLDGIELRRVGRERLGIQLAVAGNVCGHAFTLVSAQAVPDDDDGCIELAAQLDEEGDHELGIDIALSMKSKLQCHPIAGRHYAQCGDQRGLLVRAGALNQQRCLTPRVPAPSHQRCH